jgi:hypothetical protein
MYRKKNAVKYRQKAIDIVDKQIEFVEKQLLEEQNTSVCPFRKQSLPQPNLQWTATKNDLIELLYALQAAGCFNSGNVSLNQIAIYFEKIFNIDLSHFPRDFYEMRIRNDQTPFMDKLKKLLKKRMDDPKKPYNKG